MTESNLVQKNDHVTIWFNIIEKSKLIASGCEWKLSFNSPLFFFLARWKEKRWYLIPIHNQSCGMNVTTTCCLASTWSYHIFAFPNPNYFILSLFDHIRGLRVIRNNARQWILRIIPRWPKIDIAINFPEVQCDRICL